ncbi:MAG TPA: hypothetical protein VN682_09635 [Terriglobales bacterium]|nr:hypothetical protein [Terriglobales bacterium]
MKITLLICLAFALAGALAFAHTSSSQDAKPSSSSLTTKASSPFACNRFALTSAERKRHFEELGPKLRDLRKSVRELDNGYEFEFPADKTTYALLTEWAIQERECCPFFDIALRFEREGGPLWLRLSGRPGTKEFIKVDAANWVKQ